MSELIVLLLVTAKDCVSQELSVVSSSYLDVSVMLYDQMYHNHKAKVLFVENKSKAFRL